jgi:hypothetical protein
MPPAMLREVYPQYVTPITPNLIKEAIAGIAARIRA